MSELNPVRIAVIGAGAMGRNHIRFVTEEPEAELVAIADAFEGARATAEAAGVPFFTDPAQMMDGSSPRPSSSPPPTTCTWALPARP